MRLHYKAPNKQNKCCSLFFVFGYKRSIFPTVQCQNTTKSLLNIAFKIDYVVTYINECDIERIVATQSIYSVHAGFDVIYLRSLQEMMSSKNRKV